MRDFKTILKQHNYWKDSNWNATDSIYTFETGSQIEFFSTDNGDKLRGARRQRLFINEANNITFEAFQQLEVRTKEYVYIDYNPTKEFWLFTEVLPHRDDTELIVVTYRDNEALDSEIVRSLEQRKHNKNWWLVYGEGQLGEIETRIYTGWKIIDDIPHEARLIRTGLDFGYTNDPTAIVDVYKYNDGFIIDEVSYNKGLSNKMIADILLFKNPKGLVKADKAEPKSIDEIRSYNVDILPSNGGQGSVKQGINFIQDQRISVTNRSTNIIKEYRNYTWKSDKDGKILNEPDHFFSHSMDAIRYAMEDLYTLSLEDDKEQIERALSRLKNTNNITR